jgi:hypothetical protein
MNGWLGCGGLELARRGLSWRGSVDGHCMKTILGIWEKIKKARHLVAESETGTFSGTFDSWCKSAVGRFVGQAKYSQRFLFRSSNVWVSVSDYSGVSFG